MESRFVWVEAHGDPSVMQIGAEPLPKPGPGEVCIRHAAIGVNFADTYMRRGFIPMPPPHRLGTEAAGVVEAVGPDVQDLVPGARVAYFETPMTAAAYSDARVIAADQLIALPDDCDFDTAAAGLVKGLTAFCLVDRAFRLTPGMAVLVQAAAGGVGLLLSQWAKVRGATVIGVVGSSAKARLLESLGIDHVIGGDYGEVAEQVRSITGGRGVDVVFDLVGRDAFTASLDALARRGTYVCAGMSSGPLPPIDPQMLGFRGSLTFQAYAMPDYVPDRASRQAAFDAMWPDLREGGVKLAIGQRFELAQVAEAHLAIERRETVGSTLLIP